MIYMNIINNGHTDTITHKDTHAQAQDKKAVLMVTIGRANTHKFALVQKHWFIFRCQHTSKGSKCSYPAPVPAPYSHWFLPENLQQVAFAVAVQDGVHLGRPWKVRIHSSKADRLQASEQV